MKSSTELNLGLSKTEFYFLQCGEQDRTYHRLMQQVVSNIKRVLKPTLSQLTPQWDDAQDLLANTLEKFWQRLPHLEYGYLNAWLIHVCRNLHISDWRKARKTQLTNDWVENDFDSEPPAELELSFWDNHSEQVRILNHLLEKVEEERRSIFVQNQLHNQSIKDLAQQLGIRSNTLTQRHIRIMEDLHDEAKCYKSLI